MEGKIQSVTPAGDYSENNIYEVALDNGTTAKTYVKKGSFKDKRFNDGSAIGATMTYEMSPKGNFSKVNLDGMGGSNNYTPSSNGFAKPSKAFKGNDDRQTSIVRQSCLKAAVEVAVANKLGMEKLLDVASEFEQWVNRVDSVVGDKPEEHFTRTQEEPTLDQVASSEPPI